MSNRDFAIRRASKEDTGALATLAASTFRDTYSPHIDPDEIERHISVNFTPELIAAEIEDPASSVLVGCVGGEPVGYATLRIGSSPTSVPVSPSLELVRLYLEKSRIGKGYGSALMCACLEEQKRLGCDMIWLGVWNHNAAAISFYEKWGFKEAGTCQFILGGRTCEDLVMVRPESVG
jgi:diamine N-acetyltransferase